MTSRSCHLLIGLGAGALTLAGCGAASPTADLGDLRSASAKIEIVSDGGFAALHISQTVDYASRGYVAVQRHICNDICTDAPLDSARGTLPAVTVDSLFNAILTQKSQFKSDYGVTANAADMFMYTIRITSDDATQTIRADDGTMPNELRRIVTAVQNSIAAARK